jgi:hypothetical protein
LRRWRSQIQSIFYILYLLFFTSEGSAFSAYPDASPVERIRWPDPILEWSFIKEGGNHITLCGSKAHFFNGRGMIFPFLQVFLDSVLPRWKPRVQISLSYIYELYMVLWEVESRRFKVRTNLQTIDTFIETLEMLHKKERAEASESVVQNQH